MAIEIPVTLWLSETDHAALTSVARRYARTPDAQVAAWISDALAEARRGSQADRWERRRRTLDAKPALAATVDAAAESE